MELGGRKVVVVGLGKTGIQTVRFLLEKGAEIRASDINPLEKLSEDLKVFMESGVRIESGGHHEKNFLWADTIVLSPGVPFNIPPVKKALAKGIEVISELELASRFIKKPIVGITGSNGKTTTSTLVARILGASGVRVFLGGNIGTPLIQIAGEDEGFDLLVLELSSFQLQGVSTFRPNIGILLNISPNHLDHHESFEEYVNSKLKLFSNQGPDDWAIYNLDDPVVGTCSLHKLNSRKIPFAKTPVEGGVFFDGNCVRFMGELYDIKGMKLPGIHNVENAMAAIASTRVLGCKPGLIEREILEFVPLPHRIEFIREIKEARFYNDSKSTSPGATLKALESFSYPIILIAGGKDKGVSYGILRDEIERKVKLLILFGESRSRMERELGREVNTVLAGSLDEAVELAVKNIGKGDTVLFSPACSSFDMFSSYEERGGRFKQIVQDI
jgi:UDP-N-acetylmuramoylalanine--D-glutamate ligase